MKSESSNEGGQKRRDRKPQARAFTVAFLRLGSSSQAPESEARLRARELAFLALGLPGTDRSALSPVSPTRHREQRLC